MGRPSGLVLTFLPIIMNIGWQYCMAQQDIKNVGMDNFYELDHDVYNYNPEKDDWNSDYSQDSDNGNMKDKIPFSRPEYDLKDKLRRGGEERRVEGKKRKEIKHSKLGKTNDYQTMEDVNCNKNDDFSKHVMKDKNIMDYVKNKYISKLSFDSSKNNFTDNVLQTQIGDHEPELLENLNRTIKHKANEDVLNSFYSNNSYRNSHNHKMKNIKRVHNTNLRYQQNVENLERQEAKNINPEGNTNEDTGNWSNQTSDYSKIEEIEDTNQGDDNFSKRHKTNYNELNDKTEHKQYLTNVNVSYINKAFINALQDKMSIPYIKEHNHMNKTPNLPQFQNRNHGRSILQHDGDCNTTCWMFADHKKNSPKRMKNCKNNKTIPFHALNAKSEIDKKICPSSNDLSLNKSLHLPCAKEKNNEVILPIESGFSKSYGSKQSKCKENSKEKQNCSDESEEFLHRTKHHKHSKTKGHQTTKIQLPENKLTMFEDQVGDDGEHFKRNERDINRKNQNLHFYSPANKGLFGPFSRGRSEQAADPRVQEQAHDKLGSAREETPFDSLTPKRSDGNLNKVPSKHEGETDSSQFENDYNNLFSKRNNLLRLNGNEPEQIKEHIKTSFAPDTPTEKATALNPKRNEDTKQTLSSTKEPNTDQNEENDYYQFLDGRLVDEFVKRVLTKVARSKKIMKELGFGKDLGETCERCVELKPNKVPDLEDMKQSLAKIPTHDTLKCYRVPEVMEQYLNVLLSFEQHHESSVYNKIENDNSFIFTGDYDILSKTDNEVGIKDRFRSDDYLSKDSLEKQRIAEESSEDKNELQNTGNGVKSLKSALDQNFDDDEEGEHLETKRKSQDTKFNEQDGSGHRSSKEFKSNINDLTRVYDNQPEMLPFSNKLYSDVSDTNKVDESRFFNSGNEYFVENGPDPLDTFLQSGIKAGRRARKPKHETEKLNESKEYDNKDVGVGNQINGSENSSHRWDSSKEERSSFPEKGRRPYKGVTRRFSRPKNVNDYEVLPDEYIIGKDYTDPQPWRRHRDEGEYELYPNQRDFYLDDFYVPKSKQKDYSIMVKRDAESPEAYEDEEPVFFEVPDMEYNLYR